MTVQSSGDYCSISGILYAVSSVTLWLKRSSLRLISSFGCLLLVERSFCLFFSIIIVIHRINTDVKSLIFKQKSTQHICSFQEHPASHFHSYTHSHLVAAKISKVIKHWPQSCSAGVHEGWIPGTGQLDSYSSRSPTFWSQISFSKPSGEANTSNNQFPVTVSESRTAAKSNTYFSLLSIMLCLVSQTCSLCFSFWFFFCLFMSMFVYFCTLRVNNPREWEQSVWEHVSPEMKRWHGVSLWCRNGPWVRRRCWDYRETSLFLLWRNWLITGQSACFRNSVVSDPDQSPLWLNKWNKLPNWSEL